jgi:hypothetical protein
LLHGKFELLSTEKSEATKTQFLSTERQSLSGISITS